MAHRGKLEGIIEGLEFQSDEKHSFLDKRTGEVVSISDEEMQAAEDDKPIEDFPEWQQDSIKIAKDILTESDNYIELPSQFDIHEYFCWSIKDAETRDIFCSLIKGSGAFRRFKDAIHDYGIEDDWYKHRNDALKQIAIEWCQKNSIQFDE